jgi:CII-binding regulator of phage lambda lysogenization HflD
MERNFNDERGSLHDELYQANLEKDQIDQSMKEQEKLMMSAMASFYFDTLSKQEAKKQEEKRSEMSFLKRLRNSSYPLSSGY